MNGLKDVLSMKTPAPKTLSHEKFRSKVSSLMESDSILKDNCNLSLFITRLSFIVQIVESKQLSGNDCYVLTKIIESFGWDPGKRNYLISYHGHDSLASSACSRRTVTKCLNKLVEKDVLIKGINKSSRKLLYSINPETYVDWIYSYSEKVKRFIDEDDAAQSIAQKEN